MALLAHVLGGLTSVLGPVIIWLIKKDESPFVNDQGKEALNFQITVLIVWVALGVASAIPFVVCITAPLGMVLWVAQLIIAIIGGMKANEGVRYRYPVALRLVK